MKLKPCLLALVTWWVAVPAHAQSDFSTGGLTPPPPIEGGSYDANPSQTEAFLRESEEKDSGRGLQIFWLNAEAGYEYLGLQTFRAKDLVDADVVGTNQGGLALGAGLGVRLVFITLGARFRLGSFQDWQIWTLNAELGLCMPFGPLEPYFTFGGGYASLGSFDTSSVGAALDEAGVQVRGFDLRGGAGLDVYLADNFSVGANVTGELLFLTRPKVDESDLSGSTPEEELAAEVYAKDGSSIGGGVTGSVVLGLHF